MGEDRAASEGEQASVVVPTPRKPRVEQWRVRLLLLGQVIAGIGVLGAVVNGLGSALNSWSFWHGRNPVAQTTAVQQLPTATSSPPPRAVQSGQGAVPALSLVVIPFENESADQSQQWFVDSITRDVTAGLSHLEGSFVIAWPSAAKLRHQNLTPQEIGADLSVRYLVTGAVQRNGSHVRITANLVDTRTGREIWNQRFEADGNDVPSVQDEITARIAFATRTRLLQVESKRVASNKEGLRVTDLVMQCDSLHWTFKSRDELMKARQLCEQAIALDPSNAQAWAGVSGTYGLALSRGWYDNFDEARRKLDESAVKAITLDPDNAAAHNTRGQAYALHNEPVMAQLEYKRVLELDSNYVRSWGNLAQLALLLGHPEDAPKYVAQALSRSPHDPSSFIWLNFRGIAYYMLGDYAAAERDARDGIALNPLDTFSRLLLIAIMSVSGRDDEARSAAIAFRQLIPDVSIESLKIREKGRQYWREDNPRLGAMFDRAYAVLGHIDAERAKSER